MRIRAPYIKWSIVCLFLLLHFIYFATLGSFQLLFLEQIQLFRFSSDYFRSFLELPGGFITFLGEFVTQFFTSGLVASGILTFLTFILYLLTDKLLIRLNFSGFFLRLLPGFAILFLQSNYFYKPAYTIGFILVVALLVLYSSVHKKNVRFIAGTISWIIIYPFLGAFGIWLLLLMVLYEMFFENKPIPWFIIGVYLFCGFAIPFTFFRFVWFTDLPKVWLNPLPLTGINSIPTLFLILLLYPLLLLLVSFQRHFYEKFPKLLHWNFKTIGAGLVLAIILLWGIKKYGFDEKNQILMGMDHYVQNEQWEEVLKLSKKYPSTNQVVMFYTNLALYKTGRMADELFYYNQSGAKGLWLDWKRNEDTPFMGGELFYQLGYTSEASRWAFESMVLRGTNPRSLKRLVQTSIITRDYEVAQKYILVLQQTWHYKNWAKHYQQYLTDTTLILQDSELMEKRRLLPASDFLSDATGNDIGLNGLLVNHPDNRMAFEYKMSELLLTKNLDAFIYQVQKLKNFGHRQIPVHFEEALLFYMGFTKKNAVPEGYTIRESTRNQLMAYAEAFKMSGGNPAALFKQYGNTYWFYIQFVKN